MRIFLFFSCVFLVVACSNSDKRASERLASEEVSQAVPPQQSSLLSSEGFTFKSSERPLSAISGDELEVSLESGMQAQLNRMEASPSSPYFLDGIQPQDPRFDTHAGDYAIVARGFWLIGATEEAVFSQARSPGIEVFSLEENGVPERQNYAEFSGEQSFPDIVQGLYFVDGEKPYVLVRQYQSQQGGDRSAGLQKPGPAGGRPDNGQTYFIWYDFDQVLSQNTLEPAHTLTLDGRYVSSYRKGDTLYVVTRHWFWHPFLFLGSDSRALFGRTSLEGYLPSYRLGAQQHTYAAGCVSESEQGVRGLHGVYVTAIDMSEQKVIDSQCIQADANAVYFTENFLYVTADRELAGEGELTGGTDVYQFELAEGLSLTASGAVPGVVHRSRAGRLAAKVLHSGLILTTTRRDAGWNPVHGVYQVAGFDGKIGYRGVQLAEIEELTAVSITNAGVYLEPLQSGEAVFVGIDDQAGPVNPVRASKVGSAFGDSAPVTVPVGDNYALSFNEMTEVKGLQVDLLAFDVDGYTGVLDTLMIPGEGTHSSAAYDPKEILIDGSDGQLELVLPVSVYSSGASFPEWSHTELIHLKVQSGKTMYVAEERVVSQRSLALPNEYDSSWLRRGLRTDEGLQYLVDEQVYSF